MAIHRLYSELAASLVRATTDGWAPGAAPARAAEARRLVEMVQGVDDPLTCDVNQHLGRIW